MPMPRNMLGGQIEMGRITKNTALSEIASVSRNFEKLSKYRKIKNPEWSQKFRDDNSVFYLISVDVGRLSD